MKQFLKRSILALTVLSLVLGLLACGTVPSLMDDGAHNFGAGKPTEDYALKNSGALLEKLIDDFSGSYQLPTGTQMDDDDYDDAVGGETEPSTDPGDGTTPDDTQPAPSHAQVASWDDFLRVMLTAYRATAPNVRFDVVGGYSLDLHKDLQASFTQLQRDDPIFVSCVKSWRWGNGGNNYLIQIEYTMDPDTLIGIKNATAQLVDEAAAKIDITGKTPYEIVCAVNNYLCDTVYYPPNEPYAPVTHTTYGALHDGVAVCEGYACAAKLLLNKFGVRCDIQVGTCLDGGGHAWNLVELDGQWYQMDVTWNDGGGSREDYLLVTDDYMLKSRTWDFGKYPACAKTPYSP